MLKQLIAWLLCLLTAAAIPPVAVAADKKISLAEGEHTRWIDRLELPDYALALYAALEEGSDNDGVDDFLIEDKYFQNGQMHSVNDTLPLPACVQTPDFSGILVARVPEQERRYAINACQAVYSVFRQDHPEVFWISNRQWCTSVTTESKQGEKRSYIYLILRDSGNNADLRGEGYTESTIRLDIARANQNISKILNEAPEHGTRAELVRYFNNWLTMHNAYNTLVADGAKAESAGYLSALEGRTGAKGPVCSGYAGAMKTLCDRVGIPCVIVTSESHAWNNIEIEGKWYAVDVTYNDPGVVDEQGQRVSGQDGAISGHESEEYLLVGSDTLNSEGKTFSNSHEVANGIPLEGLELKNQPPIEKAAYVSEESGRQYYDVPLESWYADGVEYMQAQGFMQGTETHSFSPRAAVNRGMIAAILYRLADNPVMFGISPNVIPEGEWYTEAAKWATSYGIITSEGTTFEAETLLTREEFVSILYRYTQWKGGETSAAADLSAYTDIGTCTPLGRRALEWAVEHKLLQGTSDRTLTPYGTLTRAETATIFFRFCMQSLTK